MPLPTATFTIDRPAPGTAAVTVTGAMDVYSAPDIRRTLIDLVNEARYRQVVDLRAVDLVDSTGLSVIVGAAKRAVAHGGKLVLVADDDRVLRVLRITGVRKAIGHAATVEEALKLLEPKPAQPVAPSPSEIAAQILQARIRDEATLVPGDAIEEYLDRLVDSGEIRNHDYDALRSLADAIDDELRSAASQGRITVAIDGPSA